MKEKKLSLTSQIFIGLLSGLVLGFLVHYFLPAGPFKDRFLINGVFQLFGTGFIRLMQMLVVPLVFFSIVTGAMSIRGYQTPRKGGFKDPGLLYPHYSFSHYHCPGLFSIDQPWRRPKLV